MIELRELTKRYGAQVAVDRLSLRVESGHTLVLLGGSGCGKTTTLKMINRLVEPSSGEVRIDGHAASAVPAHELRRRIGLPVNELGV